MTVSTLNSVTTYNGDGVTTAFPTGFPFFLSGDLAVTRITIADGTRTLLIPNVDYTVAGGGGASGTVTTIGAGSPASALYQIEVKRATAQTQPLDLVSNDAMPSEDVERQFDRTMMAIQELSAQIAAIVLSGTGAFTISNRPGSGAGWYSTQVGNDFQFKKLAVSSAFALTDTADEIAVRLSRILDWQQYDDLAPLLLDHAASFGLSWRDPTGQTGAKAITTLAIGSNLATDNVALKFIGADDDGIAAGGVILDLQHNNDANTTSVARALLFGHTEFPASTDISGTPTIDLNRGGRLRFRLTGNVTSLTVTAPYNNGLAHGHIDFSQDGTGSRTIVWPSSFKWPSARTAGDKALSTAANARDRLVWDYDGTDYLVDLIKGRV